MKKGISFLLVVVLLITLSGTSVLAAGGRGMGNGGGGFRQQQISQQQPERQTRFEICAVYGCDVSGPHQHEDIWYCSRAFLLEGLGLCPVADCAILGIHEHDGAYYHCAYYGTGLGRGAGMGCCGRGMGGRFR